MKCCKCNKEIDVRANEIPAKWFGVYTMNALKKIICFDCIRKPENKEWARAEFDRVQKRYEEARS